jgi:hypothetical protein
MRRADRARVVSGIVGAVGAGGTTALATTQVFTLGTSNQVDAASTVAVKAGAAVAAPLVSLSNTSTGAAATPLALTAAPNHPALTVNTKTRVVSLDADLFDGIDSKTFAQGLTAQHCCFGTPSTKLLFNREELNRGSTPPRR